LLARTDLVVANDTGPYHLARAVHTPVVGIFWIGNAVNNGPIATADHRTLL
jgi:ADP-heptose:LPS heptosyltransferase